MVAAGLWLGNLLAGVGLKSPLSCFNKEKVETVDAQSEEEAAFVAESADEVVEAEVPVEVAEAAAEE